jgi:hypothetical protein
MKNTKKYLLITIFLIFVYYVITGIYLATYSPEKSDNYIWGMYHVHSTMSDGIYPPDKIAIEAKKVDVSFVILTDHGAPNFKASVFKEKINGVFFIGGSESGLPEGHLNFFGAKKVPVFKLPPYPPEAIEDIKEWGGFTVITYPEDPWHRWHYWDNNLYPDGIEIINISTYFRRLTKWQIAKLVLYFPFSRYYFLKYFTSPEFSIDKWNTLLKRKKVFGFYAVNAHGRTPISKNIKIPYPSYAKIFSTVGLGIDKKYKDNPEEAVRRGDFFSIVRGAGEPQIFEFYGIQNNKKINQGSSSIDKNINLKIIVKTKKLKYKIVLKQNGNKIIETTKNSIDFKTKTSGVYRAEIYLTNHRLLSSEVPWIISNPIFVNVEYKNKKVKNQINSDNIKRFPVELGSMHVEKDDKSKEEFLLKKDGSAEFSYYLSNTTPQIIDRWCALAVRKKFSIKNYKGIYIEAKSDRYIRYWIELRSKNNDFYSSFKLYPNKNNEILLPFDKFYKINGERVDPSTFTIDSLFITISTSNSKTGFSSKLKIKEFGFYKITNNG